MKRRIAVAALALAFAGPGLRAPAVEAAAADKTWCMTYCDTVHLGCKKTVGWFDMDACDKWLEGCLDGCKVND